MLTCEKLTLIRNQKTIFSQLSFSLSTSSTLIITGSNGSGKSSLLKVIAGISKPNIGKIFWGEKNVEEMLDDFHGDMQFIGHRNFLKPELTIYQNLEFYAKLADTQLAIDSALSFFKLRDLADQKIKFLSAGIQQRVKLAKLMACPASLWLLDEPSTNLDQENKEKLHGLIKVRIKEQGMVLIATHDPFFFDLGLKLNIEDFKTD
jgi:heme exporter protein A